jgi:putative toxin-antitoxin system antitoxin component (TIGR02293 family)
MGHLAGYTRHMADKTPASVRNIRRGLPLRELTSLTSELKQPVETWSKILGISPRTMLRNRVRSTRLDANISDRIERVKRIYALTQDAIGGRDKAGVWLTRPNRALHGQIPLSLLDTDAGAQIVEEELYRIRYGII